jgi:hypothetical protein
MIELIVRERESDGRIDSNNRKERREIKKKRYKNKKSLNLKYT